MFKIFLSWTVSPDVGISLLATIEETREVYSLLNGTNTVPLETATAYVESSILNLRHYLYEVPMTEKRLEEPNYLVYRVEWMDSQDEAILGAVIEMMKPETLQGITNLPCSMNKFRYLPGVITEIKLGEHLLKGNAGMAMEEQTTGSNYEGIGKDYIEKHGGVFHAFGYTSGSQGELEPICRGEELPDPNYKQTCSFKVWTYKGNPYDNYTLTLSATESKMDAFKSAMETSNWSKCKQLAIQCRAPTLWSWLSEYGSTEEPNDLVTECYQNTENQ